MIEAFAELNKKRQIFLQIRIGLPGQGPDLGGREFPDPQGTPIRKSKGDIPTPLFADGWRGPPPLPCPGIPENGERASIETDPSAWV